jgi:drug/metabolite transporter (DMT)-like permease
VFFFLALTATVAYALNSTLMAPLARRMTGLEATAWRGLSLGITMSPFLLLVPRATWEGLRPSFYLMLPVLWALTVAANRFVFMGQRHLPVGINIALMITAATLVTAGLGVVAFGDRFTTLQLLLGIAMLAQAALLGYLSSRGQDRSGNIGRGVLISIAGGALLGAAQLIVGYLSRQASPYLLGYAWEFGTGLTAYALLAAMSLRRGGGLPVPPVPFYKILLAVSPTAFGSTLFAVAITQGPIGLAGAIQATQGAFAALLSYFIIKERLRWTQVVLIVIMVLTLACLKWAMG